MTISQDFFALVERHLTPAMLEARYVKIGEYEGMTSAPGGAVLSSSHTRPPRSLFSSWLRKHGGAPKVVALDVGYEGSDGDEQWIHFYPDSRELDLREWRDVLDGRADWDVRNDRVVRDEVELERRLTVLGAAIRAGTGEGPSMATGLAEGTSGDEPLLA